jgi:hypothetical protein
LATFSYCQFMKTAFLSVIFALCISPLFAQQNGFETSIPSGKNFDKAKFRLWVPDNRVLKGILVLMPGSNGDGRPEVEDKDWQNFALKQHLALLGCQFTDKPHKDTDIEEYIAAKDGSGQALLTAIEKLAETSNHPELQQARLLLWGFSAGGQFNYEFTCWKPERVIAFVVNKGGVYYSAIAPATTRETPGIFFTGEKDLSSRTSIIKGIYETNRRFGAVWCYGNELGVKHNVGASKKLATLYFEKMLPLRLTTKPDKNGNIELTPIPPVGGYLGDAKTKTFHPATSPATDETASWLPDADFGNHWIKYLKGEL